MALRVVVAMVGILVSRPSHADHHGMAMSPGEVADESSFAASISVLAARYDTGYYGGDYESVVPSLAWSRGRFAASASLALYRLEENGLRLYGPGDFVVSGQAAVLDGDAGHAGVMFAVSAPTANDRNGLGMGHPMAMPAAWGMWLVGRATFTASLGYSRALASLEDHVHGMWPLVEPMNMSEITWSGGAEVALDHGIRVAARVFGGVPIVAPGIDRIIGSLRVGWGRGRVSTAAELQGGVVGDPFTVRALVETALRF